MSTALALALVVGLVFFVGDALYVVLILGAYALVASTVGFVLGGRAGWSDGFGVETIQRRS